MFKVIGGLIIAVVLVCLMAAFGSWYIIDQGERGVVTRNGKVIETADPGMHFKLPFVDSVDRITVQQKTRVFDKGHGNSRDQQYATAFYSVTYSIPAASVANIYSEYRTAENAAEQIIDRQAPARFQSAFGKFTAADTVTKRDELTAEFQKGLQASVGKLFTIDSVQVENVRFSDEYNQKIEENMKAEIEIRTQQQNLQKEQISADIARTKAKGAADAKRANAQAEADSIKMKGDAEAASIKAKADALAQNALLIEYIKATTWNGEMPQTMIPGGATPMINVNTNTSK